MSSSALCQNGSEDGHGGRQRSDVLFFSFAGTDARFERPYIYVETIGGGAGARYNKDGLDAVHVHMTNTSNLPVEALEMEYPLMVEKYALHENSGGAGKISREAWVSSEPYGFWKKAETRC